MRLVVASSATALAPFSQNSATCRLPPSGHAHPGQSNPSFWFTFSSVSAVRLTPICWYDCFSAAVTPGIPAASSFSCDSSRPRSSGSWIGGLRLISHPLGCSIPRLRPVCEGLPMSEELQAITLTGGAVRLIDQTALPGALTYLSIRSVDKLVSAIRRLAVRGAPALGAAGAYGVALALLEGGPLDDALVRIRTARPTA